MLNTTNNISPIPTRNYKPQVSKHDIDIVGKTISKTVKKASKAVKRESEDCFKRRDEERKFWAGVIKRTQRKLKNEGKTSQK